MYAKLKVPKRNLHVAVTVLDKPQRPQKGCQSKGCIWVMWQFLVAVIKHHSQKQLVNVYLVAVLERRTHNVREKLGAGSQNKKLNDHLSSHKEKRVNLEWMGLCKQSLLPVPVRHLFLQGSLSTS